MSAQGLGCVRTLAGMEGTGERATAAYNCWPQARIAAISGFTPRMFGTLVKLSARTANAISVATLGIVRVMKCIAPIRALIVPNSKIESTVRYLGIEVDDAIEIANKIDS